MISKNRMYKILKRRQSASAMFHDKTSFYNYFTKYIPYEEWPSKWKKIHYKEYIRSEKYKLDISHTSKPNNLIRTLGDRTSVREYGSKALPYKKLSQIIYYSCGVKPAPPENNNTKRFYPSAGARYPIELYIITNNVQSLGRYSYHYNIKKNYLEKLYPISNYTNYVRKVTQQDFVSSSSCLIVLTAIFGRTKVKYGDRGYRYCLIEAGHIAQNISLLCSSMNVGLCAIGGFLEVDIEKHLDLDKRIESPIYLLSIGNLE